MQSGSLPTLDWDYRNVLMHAVSSRGDTYFTYDAEGQRVRKVVVQGDTIKERIYLGAYEIYRERALGSDTATLQRRTLHINDDRRRLAVAELLVVGTPATPNNINDGPAQLVRYQLDNHLGSAVLELDGGGKLLSYEEFHAYGTAAYRATDGILAKNRKRYAYVGKERDEETGLYYYGARYYAPWLGRWISPDPSGLADGDNLYSYVHDNPCRFIDSTGNRAEESYWHEVLSGIHSAQEWVGHTSDVAGSATTTGISKAAHYLHLNGRVSDAIAAGVGAVVYTGGQVVGGILMVGPDTLAGIAEVPELVSTGAGKIRAGIEHRNWEPVVEGTGKILEAAGNVASAGLLVESSVQAVKTRSALAGVNAPTPEGFNVTVEGPRPSTGATRGTTYHRVVRDASGDIVSKTTTAVSKEGAVVRQHADFYGKQTVDAGATTPYRSAAPRRIDLGRRIRAGTPQNPKFGIQPTLPEAWTGTPEIASPKLGAYPRTKVLGTSSTSKSRKPD